METLSAAIGDRLRQLREELGLRQDDVASAARGLGLRWSRVAVARLEAGLRQLEAGEFLMLPEVLMVASIRVRGRNELSGIERVVELADLLPQSGVMALTPECHIDVRHLRLMLEGRYLDVELRDMDVPLMRELRRQQTVGVAAIGRRLAQSTELHDVLDAIWAKAPVAVKAKAVQEAAGEAEQKAARKLGVNPAAVALAAQRRFGRSLTSERDRRVLERPLGESPRRIQAVRGHVTRTLIGELVPLIEGAKLRRQRS
jgi:transcriptional regulator with XRE-family HTH domain